MAINNHSSINGYHNSSPCVYQLIVKFDKLKTDKERKDHINKLKGSEVKFCREMAVLLKERIKEPPPPIPDKTIFVADIHCMGIDALRMFCDDMRYLLATKYRTY